MSHLRELRRRTFWALGGFALATAGCFVGKEPLLGFLLQPLHPLGVAVQTLSVTEQFFAYLRLSALAGFLLALPWLLWQVWAFLAPGLYLHERRRLRPMLVAAPLLFYSGMAFAFFVMLPPMLNYLLAFAQPGVAPQLRLSEYLGFLFTLCLGVGAVFNLPLLLLGLMAAGFVTPQALAGARRWVILVTFIVAAILTPPDPISQTLLAVPTLLLYELAILLGRRLVKPPQSS